MLYSVTYVSNNVKSGPFVSKIVCASSPFPFPISLHVFSPFPCCSADLKSSGLNIDNHLQPWWESTGMVPPTWCCVINGCGTICAARPKPPSHTHKYSSPLTYSTDIMSVQIMQLNTYTLVPSVFLFFSHTFTLTICHLLSARI